MTERDIASPGSKEALREAQRLVSEGRLFAAKQSLAATLSNNGQSAVLLQELASIEYKQGEYADAAAHLADAAKLGPPNISISRDRLNVMRASELYAEARSIANGLPAELLGEPSIRAILGDVYRAIGWQAHAVDAYGSLHGLSPRARYARSASWLQSGGPFRRWRSRVRRIELNIDDAWKTKSAAQRAGLASLNLPGQQDISRLADKLDSCLLILLTAQCRGEAAIRRAGRDIWRVGLFGLLWLLALALGYIFSETVDGFIDAAIQALLVTELAVIATFVIDIAVTRYSKQRWNRVTLILRRSLAVAVIGLLLSYYTRPLTWPSIAGLVLTVAGILYALLRGTEHYYADEIRRLANRHPQEYILANVLFVVDEIGDFNKRNDLKVRYLWKLYFRNAALALEHCLPYFFDEFDPTIQGLMAERVAGAANAVRALAGYIALPKEGTWDQLTTDLHHNARMIAAGDFGSLQPGHPSLSSQSRARHRNTLVNILLVAVPLVLLAAIVGVLIVLRDQTMANVATTTAITTFVALLAGVLITPLQAGMESRPISQDIESDQ